MTEVELERKLVKLVKGRGGLCLKFTSPGTTGVPDRLVLLPDGQMGFVEVKAPGQVPRPQQNKRIQGLRNLGFRVYVLDSPDQIGGILDAIQTPRLSDLCDQSHR